MANKRINRGCKVTLLLAASVLSLASAAGAGRGPKLALAWQAPTPRDGSAITAEVGSPLTLILVAASSSNQLVLVGNRGLPAGAKFSSAFGKPGQAQFTWTPTADQVGEHVVTFGAQTHDLPHVYAQPRSLLVFVRDSSPGSADQPFALGGPNGMSRAAPILRAVSARSRPSASAPVVARLRPQTPERVQNIAHLLEGQIGASGQYWVRVRLPILPNGSTGWVQRTALGSFRTIWTRLVIDRALFTATLYRRGAPVFQTRVGVGKSYWPTPAGEFYVRERITGFSDLVYGPIAFGTNARSAVLTDWPGGGFIGIHGTSSPEILPGRVSHGCVRMANPAIRRLARLMPVGTPVTIH